MAINFGAVLRVTEMAARPLRRTAEAANALAEKSDKMSTQLRAANGLMIGLAVAADAAIGIMAARAAVLEQSMARLSTVTRASTKTVAGSLQDAEAAARRFSNQFTASANEVIRAQFQIATAGVDVSEQIVATQSAFKLARATMGEFTQAAQVLGSFLNTFGRTAEFSYLAPAAKMEAITDRLSESVKRFQVTLPVLAESFKFIVGPASQLNLKLAEVSAAIGVLNTAGFRGTLAGTALSNMFNKLDRATDKLNLNPDKFIDLNGNLKDLTSFLEEVNRALSDKTPIEAQNALIDTFDIRAGRVAKTLLNNVTAIKRFSAELEVSKGATERMADAVENTTSASFKKLQNASENLATTLGKTFNKVAGPIVNILAKFVNKIEMAVKATGILIPVMLLLGGSLLTLGALAGVATIAFAGLSSAMTAFAAATGVAAVAVYALQIALGAGLVGLLVIAAAAIVAIVVALGFAAVALYDWIAGADEGKLSAEQISKGFGSAADATARFAAELSRLNAAQRAGVKSAGPAGVDLGETSLSAEVKRLTEAGMQFDAAVSQAFKTTGGFSRVLRDLAKTTGGSVPELERLRKSFVEIRSSTDRTFKQLTQLGQATEFTKERIAAFDTAARAMSGGTAEAGNALKSVATSFAQLKVAIERGVAGADESFFRQLFENFKGNLENLRNVEQKGIRAIVAEFDARKLSGDPITDFEDDKFRELVKGLEGIGAQLRQNANTAQRFNQVLTGAKTATAQASRAAKTVSNLVKNASLGGISFQKAMAQSAVEAGKASDSLKAFLNIIPRVGVFLDKFKDALGDTAEFKELQKIFEKRLEIEVGLRTTFNEAEVERQSIKMFAAIEKEFGRFNSRQQKAFQKLGSAFSQTIGNALSGELARDGKSAFAELGKNFKQEFIDKIQGQIGTRIGAKFAGEFEKIGNIASNLFDGLSSDQLLQGVESGDIARQLNSKIQSAIPALRKLTGGDIFDLGVTDELVKSFRDINTSASVALVTSGNRSAAVLRQLQSVLAGGPAKTLEGLNTQATQLRNLLKDASTTGASGAIRPLETALKAVLDRLAERGPAAAARNVAQQIQKGEVAITTAANSFSAAVATLVPAGQRFVSLVGEAFDKIQLKSVTLADNPKKLEITLNAGAKKYEIQIDKGSIGVTTEDGLTEDEVRRIVDDVKAQIEQENEEFLRNLTDELRKR